MYEYKIQKEGFREDGYYTATVKVWEKAKSEEPNGDDQDEDDQGEQEEIKWRIEVIYGKRIPSEEFKIREIERRIALLDIQESIPEPERIYTAQEVTGILQEKRYLESWEEFSEDMPDIENRPPEPEPEEPE